ncbi:MAG: hypothetical protein K8F30_04535, partial [Taibaiella sp.]|nr:hypothetical protein [Taibaiella sp.]
NDFSYFEYKESLKTTGTGINLKLGFIYNFTSNFRAGAAFHTPTFFGMTDVQNRSITSNTEGFKDYLGYGPDPFTHVDADPNEYNYSIITPWRAVLSAAGIIGKYGFISMDYEFVDYSSARFSFDDLHSYDEEEVNNGIKAMYKGGHNVRLGGEVRFDIVMFRLGFGYYGNPYKNTALGSERLNYSAGVGLRIDNIFFDLGFNRTSATVKEPPYAIVYNWPNGDVEVIDVPTATIKNSYNNLAMTVGVKF